MKDIAPQPRLGEIGLINYPPCLMKCIMRRYNATIRSAMAKLGLTTPKMRALAVLSVMDGHAIWRLAVHAIIKQSTLSRALDSLQADELLRREADATDSRSVRVFVTDYRLNSFEGIWPHMAKTYQNMFARINPDEQHDFVATMQKIHANTRKTEV